MSKFDRKVERTKKEYTFTKKKEEKKSVFKDNFHLKWIQFNMPTIITFVIAFLISTLVLIPILMNFINSEIAFVLGHGLITGFLLVVSACLIYKEKLSLPAFLTRYFFIGSLLALVSFLSLVITSWLN